MIDFLKTYAWARHDGDAYWHAVEAVEDSVITRCRGRWPVSDEFEKSSNPPLSERCGACAK